MHRPDHCWTWSTFTSKNFSIFFFNCCLLPASTAVYRNIVKKPEMRPKYFIFSWGMATNTWSQLSDCFQGGHANILFTWPIWHTERFCQTEKAKSYCTEKDLTLSPPKKNPKPKQQTKARDKTLARCKNWNHLKSDKQTKNLSRGNSPLTDGFITTNNVKSL